jgi:hypothetical protein
MDDPKPDYTKRLFYLHLVLGVGLLVVLGVGVHALTKVKVVQLVDNANEAVTEARGVIAQYGRLAATGDASIQRVEAESLSAFQGLADGASALTGPLTTPLGSSLEEQEVPDGGALRGVPRASAGFGPL